MTKQRQSLIISFLIGSAILVGLGQWTKGLAVQSLKGQKPFVIWNGVFEFYYSKNRGVTFEMMQEKRLFFFLITVLVLGIVAYLIWKVPPEGRHHSLTVCLVMISAGAIGNTIDRVSQGCVMGFLYFKLVNFPVLNVADCYVTVGAACLVFLIVFYYKDEDMACFSFKRH